MNDSIAVPKWFWAVAVMLLLWSVAGIISFYVQLTLPYERLVAIMGKPGADCISAMPQWLWWVFGTAVWSGAFGSLAVLLRRAWAQPLYLISLLAVIIQFGHSFGVAKIQNVLGWSSAGFPVFIIAMAAFELWLSTWTKKRGWLV